MSKRAERRHHYQRLKEKRIRDNYWGFGSWRNGYDDSQVGYAANTPKPCSCYMCRNPRHNSWATRLERMTRQELKSEVDYNQQLDEIQLRAWEDENIYDWAKYDYWPTSEDFHMTKWEEDDHEPMTKSEWESLYWWDNYDADLTFQAELDACYEEYHKQNVIDFGDKEDQISDCWWQREDEWESEYYRMIDGEDL